MILAWEGLGWGKEFARAGALATPSETRSYLFTTDSLWQAADMLKDVSPAKSEPSRAAGSSLPSPPSDDIHARLERQDQQIRNLQDQLEKLLRIDQRDAATTSPRKSKDVKKDSGHEPSTGSADGKGSEKTADLKRNEKKKEEEKEEKKEEWYEIGTDFKVVGTFRDGLFLWLDTPHKDFTMHLGGWMQWDNVWWDQSPGLLVPADGRPGPAQGVATGAPLGGIGDLEDGEFFRRIRFFVEGNFWENGI
jgi:hypothetical protein